VTGEIWRKHPPVRHLTSLWKDKSSARAAYAHPLIAQVSGE